MTPRARWIEEREDPRGRAAVLLPLVPAAWLYAAGARLHRALYGAGIFRKTVLPIRVVSVGNLVVGGTGKTPTAAWIASALRRRGHKVALASRGYARPATVLRGTFGSLARGRAAAQASPAGDAVVVVSDGCHVLSRAEVAGDEPMLLAAHAPGVPVLVGRDRARVGRRAFSAFDAEVLVLDDGFQHHRLHRDVDVVTVDGGFGFGNRRVLPRGPLRESLTALRFAGAIGVIDGPLRAEDAALIAELAPGAMHFTACRKPSTLRPLRGGAAVSPAVLDGATVGLLAALARPASLRRTLEQLGAVVVAERVFADHHAYREHDLRGLRGEAPLWITTEKDAIKITPDWAGAADIRVLSIDLEVSDSHAFLDWLEARLR